MDGKRLKLTVTLDSPKEILERYYPNGGLGGLVIDGSPPGPLGQTCELVVRLVSPAERHFNVLGQISWARHKGGPYLKESFGVDFVKEDAAGRTRLLTLARDDFPVAATRYQERLSARLPVKVFDGQHTRKEEIIDISQGGAFVRTKHPLAVGAVISFELQRGLLSRIRLKGRVAWVREGGEGSGMGVEFVYEDDRQAKKIRGLLEELVRNSHLSRGDNS